MRRSRQPVTGALVVPAQQRTKGLVDVAGVVVLKETFSKKNILENANETIKLDISTLPAGLYLVKWNDGTTSGTKRVVKR